MAANVQGAVESEDGCTASTMPRRPRRSRRPPRSRTPPPTRRRRPRRSRGPSSWRTPSPTRRRWPRRSRGPSIPRIQIRECDDDCDKQPVKGGRRTGVQRVGRLMASMDLLPLQWLGGLERVLSAISSTHFWLRRNDTDRNRLCRNASRHSNIEVEAEVGMPI